MCGIYVVGAMVVLMIHAGKIPMALGQIFSGAFTGDAVTGGVVGVIIQGFKRAAFSNEAGIVLRPLLTQQCVLRTLQAKVVSLLEPFIDTVVVCTMTALVIIITGTWQNAEGLGVGMTSSAFESVISWFPMILALAVILFAFSMCCMVLLRRTVLGLLVRA